MRITSSQILIEEFPASSEVFVCIIHTTNKIHTNGISVINKLTPTVQPVPAPCSTKALANSRIKEGGSSQNDTLFRRGKAISGAPICTGTK